MFNLVHKAKDIGKDEDVRVPVKSMEEAKALQEECMGKHKYKPEIEEVKPPKAPPAKTTVKKTVAKKTAAKK